MGLNGIGDLSGSPKGDVRLMHLLIEVAASGCILAGLLTICACIVSARSACRAEQQETEPDFCPARASAPDVLHARLV